MTAIPSQTLGGGGGASGGACLPQPRWAVCATGAGAHRGQTSREGEIDIWWTVGTTRGGAGHLGLTHTETQRGRLWTACGQRRMGSKNSQTTSATTSTTTIPQLLGATDAQTAHHATTSTAPVHQPLGSANAETTPARAPAAAADRKQRPDATCEEERVTLQGPLKKQQPDGMSHRGGMLCGHCLNQHDTRDSSHVTIHRGGGGGHWWWVRDGGDGGRQNLQIGPVGPADKKAADLIPH